MVVIDTSIDRLVALALAFVFKVKWLNGSLLARIVRGIMHVCMRFFSVLRMKNVLIKVCHSFCLTSSRS